MDLNGGKDKMTVFNRNDLITGQMEKGEIEGYFLVSEVNEYSVKSLVGLDGDLKYTPSVDNNIIHVLDGVSNHRMLRFNQINSMTKYLSERYAIEDIFYLLSLYYKKNKLQSFINSANENKNEWYFVFNSPTPDIKIYIKEQKDYMTAGYMSSTFVNNIDEVKLYGWLKNIIEYIIANVRTNTGVLIGNQIVVMSSLDKETQKRIEKITESISNVMDDSYSKYGWHNGSKVTTTSPLPSGGTYKATMKYTPTQTISGAGITTITGRGI